MPTYKRKPLIVEAHQMTVDSKDQRTLAEWCRGQLRGVRLPPPKRFIQMLSLQDPNGWCELEAHPGDWIVKETDGNYYVYRSPYFELTHTLIGQGGE